MPFNLGPMESILIVLALLLIFGAKRLPELGSGLGKGIREFRRSFKDIQEDITRDDDGSRQIRNPSRAQVAPPTEEIRPVAETRTAVEQPRQTGGDS